MTEDQIIDQIIYSFTNYNLRDIQEMYNSPTEFTIAEFILCSCLIDQISGFRYNTDKVGKRYKKFVREYLPNYNPEELYDDLRNKLVHNYSLGRHYNLTSKSAHLHLQTINGNTYLTIEYFLADIKSALSTYFNELRNDMLVRQNALNWYKQYNIIGQNM